jgi:hypothetical protein
MRIHACETVIWVRDCERGRSSTDVHFVGILLVSLQGEMKRKLRAHCSGLLVVFACARCPCPLADRPANRHQAQALAVDRSV